MYPTRFSWRSPYVPRCWQLICLERYQVVKFSRETVGIVSKVVGSNAAEFDVLDLGRTALTIYQHTTITMERLRIKRDRHPVTALSAPARPLKTKCRGCHPHKSITWDSLLNQSQTRILDYNFRMETRKGQATRPCRSQGKTKQFGGGEHKLAKDGPSLLFEPLGSQPQNNKSTGKATPARTTHQPVNTWFGQFTPPSTHNTA